MTVGELIKVLSKMEDSLEVYATCDFGNGEARMEFYDVKLRKPRGEGGEQWVDIPLAPEDV